MKRISGSSGGELEPFGEHLGGLVDPAGVAQGDAQPVPGLGLLAAPQLDDAALDGDRLLEPAGILERVAEIAQHARIVRGELQRPAMRHDRRVELPAGAQDGAEIGEGARQPLALGDGLIVELQRIVVPALAMRRDRGVERGRGRVVALDRRRPGHRPARARSAAAGAGRATSPGAR